MESISPLSNWVRRLVWLFGGMGALGAVLTWLVLIRGVDGNSRARALVSSAGFLLFGALGFVYIVLWIANSRLLVCPGIVGYQDIFGRRRTWNAAEVTEVVDVSVAYNRSRAPQRAIYFLGLTGRRLFALNPVAWPPGSVDRLVQQTGREIQSRPQPMTPNEFRRDCPQATSWVGRHSALILLLILAAGLLVAAGITIAGNGRP